VTLNEFTDIAAERIPTAGEMIAFARGMGWKILDNGERAALKVPDVKDPVAVKFARLLSREPYRTNVLTELRGHAAYDLPDEARPDIIAGAAFQRGE